ncbi:secreted protein [Melampsora americana]|nr:secreted protein [Melampsora americana]
MSRRPSMKIVLLVVLACHSCFTMAAITFRLERQPSPNQYEFTAYRTIYKAMKKAVHRYNKYIDVNVAVTVMYVPGVPTADGNRDAAVIRFGSDPRYWNERVALHEISHILGVGWPAFEERCQTQSWYVAKRLLRQFTNDRNAEIHCGGGHFWPYGLNYPNEFSEKNANRHCRMVRAMMIDGMR